MMPIDWTARKLTADPAMLSGAFDAFSKSLGAAHVITEPAALASIARTTVPDSRAPSAILYPASAAEVSSVLRIASRFGVPLWPCSKGRNWGYGSAAPFVESTVVLHLERMNRIVEVNEELAYAVIEPGVTYRQLREHLSRHHPDLWCDCTDGPPDGSVIGNALERGLGVTPYSDHFATLCGLEVLLPDGSCIQTGGGAPGHCPTWNTHKWGVGPYLEGLFSQSSLGVVVKAGVWLLRRPQAFASFTFDLARESDLPQLIDIVRELSLRGVLPPGCHLVNEVVGLAVLAQYPPELVGLHSRLPAEVVRSLCDRLTIPKWMLGGGIHGTRRHVNAVQAELRDALRGLGRLNFFSNRAVQALQALHRLRAKVPSVQRALDALFRGLTGKSLEAAAVIPHVHSVLQGSPSDYFVRHAYLKSRLDKPADAHPDRDDCGLIWFAPIAPCTGKHVVELLDLCRRLFELYDFDFYAALLPHNVRSIIVLTSIFYDKASRDETGRAQALYDALSKSTRQAGYEPYRTGTQGLADLFSSAPEYAAVLKRIKSALDPLGILAPGKLPPA